ncbi:hypothetical protein HY285_02870 [Candidatus Peregrinibacteria bacterium]|nr:hypothetical protein [Candidatus Peregrinibacteria bacterium]MBI3816459.1 hypothetical protein [Candidatus Peregrinibacteria bacterium]
MHRWTILFSIVLLCTFVLIPINVTACSGGGADDLPSLAKEIAAPSGRIEFFGGLVLLRTFFSHAPIPTLVSPLPSSCTRRATMWIGFDLALSAIIAAHLLTLSIGAVLAGWHSSAILFFSREYGLFFLRGISLALFAGAAIGAIIAWLLSLPSVSAWAVENTTMHAPVEAVLPFGAATALLTLAVAALRWDVFSNVLERLLFFVEAILFITLAFWLLFNVHLPLLLVSIPFPFFS